MSKLSRAVVFCLLFVSGAITSPVFAQLQQSPSSFKAVHVIGLEGIKHDTKGNVTVSKDTLEFVTGPTKSDVPIASVQDVLTGADSQRSIGGTLGTLSMFAPYGSGRFLSLFRTKIDTLTITYHDPNGGLHGAILTLPQGQASLLKAEMVTAGAKTSVSPAEEAEQQAADKKAKEKKQ